MEHSVIFDTARRLARKVKMEKPFYGGLDAAVIISGSSTFLGVTGVNVVNGEITDVPADTAAFFNMKNAGERTAAGLAVIRLEDMSFIPPSAEAMELLFRTNIENDSCLVCLGENESKPLSALRLGTDAVSMTDGFDFDETDDSSSGTASAYTTANVISGVSVEKSNPFYENTENVAPPQETLSAMTEEQRVDEPMNTAKLPELTEKELLKQARKRKDVAKSNFLFRRKHQ